MCCRGSPGYREQPGQVAGSLEKALAQSHGSEKMQQIRFLGNFQSLGENSVSACG